MFDSSIKSKGHEKKYYVWKHQILLKLSFFFSMTSWKKSVLKIKALVNFTSTVKLKYLMILYCLCFILPLNPKFMRKMCRSTRSCKNLIFVSFRKETIRWSYLKGQAVCIYAKFYAHHMQNSLQHSCKFIRLSRSYYLLDIRYCGCSVLFILSIFKFVVQVYQKKSLLFRLIKL